jgi:hypothetical protein
MVQAPERQLGYLFWRSSMESTMRNATTVFLAGAAIAGLTGLALAAGPAIHEMTVQGPDGAVAHVRYTGDVAPKVRFVQGPTDPFGVSFWGGASPFAELDRITALMDRQMAQMMYQARMIQQQSLGSPLSQAVLTGMPAGSASYSFISTTSGNGVCTRTTQITASPNGGKPQVVSQTSGNCGDGANQLKGKSSQPTSGLQTISYKPGHSEAQPRRGI